MGIKLQHEIWFSEKASQKRESLSPALQRWVVGIRSPSAVGTTEQDLCAVPTGLGVCYNAFPALKRWAKLFRACGARLEAVQSGQHADLGSRNGQPVVRSLEQKTRSDRNCGSGGSDTAEWERKYPLCHPERSEVAWATERSRRRPIFGRISRLRRGASRDGGPSTPRSLRMTGL